MTPLFWFGDFLEWLTELREMFTYVYWSIKRRCSKGYDGKPDGEIDRARFRNSPCLGVSVPVAEACHPPSVWLCSPSWKLSQPCTFGIFMEVSFCRFSPLLEDGDRRG